ncbi:SYNGR2 isoform 4, partial [Pongo abelii]
MESGAYGAAKAGGSFDLRRFLTQPQVVARAVCLLSGPSCGLLVSASSPTSGRSPTRRTCWWGPTLR